MPDPIVNNDDDNTPTAEELLAQETAAALARGDTTADDDGDGADDDKGAVDEDETQALQDELDEGKEKSAGEGAAEEKDDEKKSSAIPLDRHKKILDKERDARIAAETALSKSTKGAADTEFDTAIAAQEKEITALEAVYAKALIDADAKLASDTMGQIRRLDRQIGDAKSDRKAAATETRAVESTRYDLLVSSLEKDYPELNPDHEDFDEGLATEVLEIKNAFVASGSTPTQALKRAMKYMLAADAEPEVDGEKETDPAKLAEAKAARKAAGIEKKAKAASGTPPNTEKVGLSSDKLGSDGKVTAVEIGKMSQAQFAKLSEKDLAEARGDTM